MTPDAAGIEAALAAGLAAHAHRWRGALLRCRQPCEWTASSGALPDRDQLAEHRAHVAAALLPVVTQAQAEALREVTAERDAFAAAVDRVRRRHPRGDEESGYLAPGLWCPTCGRERTDNGHGGCPDRQALIIPGQPLRARADESSA